MMRLLMNITANWDRGVSKLEKETEYYEDFMVGWSCEL